MPKALSTLHSLVAPFALGCPIPLIDQALIYAASDFCRRTHAVQETSVQSVVAGRADYDVDVPPSMLLSLVLAAFYGDRPLASVAADEVASGIAVRGPSPGETATVGRPNAFFVKDVLEPVVSLFPTPDMALASGLAIRAAFEPAPTATTLPDRLADYYADALAQGALAYLLVMPGQPFTNPPLGQMYGRLYESAVQTAKTTARAGLVRRQMRVQPRRFP
jgi:hypothetical protein